jgi:hypothetical protein
MDARKDSHGLLTFIEHWGLVWFALITAAMSQVLALFTRLSVAQWIWCYGIGLFTVLVGAALIFHAKLPLYQQRRFFTFGSRALPENRRASYRWGYRFVMFAVLILVGMLFSLPR